jgi:TPR repeat protein
MQFMVLRPPQPQRAKHCQKKDCGKESPSVGAGFMSDGGLGTALDRTAAASWYRQAAEQGDPWGQNNLADLYLRGEGVPQRDDLALVWFQKAAANGNTAARIKLGYMYATGRATPRDAESAYIWLLAASLAGDRRGLDYLPPLEAQLSPGQLERAKRRAKDLQANPQSSIAEALFVP